jgi:spermidine/putrescine transport system permease protein
VPRLDSARLGLAVFLAPPLVTLITLFIIPIALMIAYGFWSVDNDYQLVQTLSLDQYRKVFTEPIYLTTLAGSAYMALLTTVLCVALALPLAWFIVRRVPARWRVLLIVGLILPGWVSVLIRTYSMNLVIGESGLLNWLLMSAGIISQPLRILFTQAAVVIGLVYIYLPYTLVPIYAAIDRLDPAILEAAENLGAGPVSRFVKIVVPLIMPGIVAGSIITFIPAVGEYLVPNLLGGLQGIMYGNLIATAFQSFDWPLGAALSVTLLGGILVCLAIFARLADLNRSLLAE